MMTLIQRHMKLFFKDYASVFFSLLSVFIIIALYVLFLSENISSSIPAFDQRAAFVFLWMFAGIVAVTTATAPLGALGKFIEDRVGKKSEDLLLTKITKQTLAYSYVFYSFIMGLIFTALLFVFGLLYTYIKFSISLELSLSLLAVLLISTLMHTLLFYFITSSLRTMSAFSGFSTIVGTLIGFLAGIYIPIGILPTYLQKIMILFPTTQSTVLLRELLMTDVLMPMKQLLPDEAYAEIIRVLGVQLQWGDHVLSTQFSWMYVIGVTIVLGVLVWVRNRK
ncbi:hypothetical protein DV702_04790 [Sporosarcina sp. PTS2304]|uniref:ABC transporter permease n=1 Tax=Sporosarcina sp. PTS2304 TaxID=2283194 RepID=UPI000E0DC30B|nr:ABC transporter permease [Sporosarcina sp. PTS2304]AXH99111.1 hypothetical protein DV702_04790 [Sporosarcina sp. PTS2304]